MSNRKLISRNVTAEDLKNYPELVEKGIAEETPQVFDEETGNPVFDSDASGDFIGGHPTTKP